MFAERTRKVQASPTFRVAGLARELRARGEDVVDFSVGEPDFPTPAAAKEAGKRAIDADRTRYTANEGTIELRRAIAAKLAADNGLEYAPDEIVVSPGAKASLFCASMALFGPGDEVLVPTPCWPTHPEQVRLAGAEPVFVECRESDGFPPARRRPAARPHAAHQGAPPQLPLEPDRACPKRSEMVAIARVAARARPRRRRRRDLREAPLRRPVVRQHRLARRDARAHRRRQRPEQGVRDDRLAPRLRRRSPRGRRRDFEDPEPQHGPSGVDGAGRRGRSAHLVRRRRRADARGVRGSPHDRGRGFARHPRDHLRDARRSVLRVRERVRIARAAPSRARR